MPDEVKLVELARAIDQVDQAISGLEQCRITRFYACGEPFNTADLRAVHTAAIEATRPTAATDDVVKELVEAGTALAETVKMNKAGLTQALTKRELGILMDDLHRWNVAALAKARTGVTLNG